MTTSTAVKQRAHPRLAEENAQMILLATAGDDESLGAVKTAAAVARRIGAKVEVLAIVTPFPHGPPTGMLFASAAEIDAENRKSILANVRKQLRAVRNASAWPVHVELGWPVECIGEAARRWNASLIVMGLGRHSAMDRLFGTETAIGVAKHSDVPLLAVPADNVQLPRHAVAAIDFTPSSVAGARLAAHLVPERTGDVTLVHTSIFAKEPTEAGSMIDLYGTGARRRLDLISRQIRRATHRRVKTALADRPIADTLSTLADEGRVDLIALGSHERSLIDRLLIGSVRTQLLRRSTCPVLIMPEKAKADE